MNIITIDVYGTKRFWKNNILHRDDGPAVERPDGQLHWYVDGVLHRVDGPAIINDVFKVWYYHGIIHREDGPAIEYADGGKEWFINGFKFNCSSQEEFERTIKLKVFW